MFDNKLPFGTEAIPNLLRLEYFSTKGGANILAFTDIVQDGYVKDTTIALMITVVGSCLFILFSVVQIRPGGTCPHGVF